MRVDLSVSCWCSLEHLVFVVVAPTLPPSCVCLPKCTCCRRYTRRQLGNGGAMLPSAKENTDAQCTTIWERVMCMKPNVDQCSVWQPEICSSRKKKRHCRITGRNFDESTFRRCIAAEDRASHFIIERRLFAHLMNTYYIILVYLLTYKHTYSVPLETID